MDRDFVPALGVTWRVLSAGTAFLLLLPCVLPQGALSAWVPACEGALQGKPCPLCGMTTAFYLIASGDVPGALAANPASLALYLGFILNLMVLWAVTRLKRNPAHAIR